MGKQGSKQDAPPTVWSPENSDFISSHWGPQAPQKGVRGHTAPTPIPTSSSPADRAHGSYIFVLGNTAAFHRRGRAHSPSYKMRTQLSPVVNTDSRVDPDHSCLLPKCTDMYFVPLTPEGATPCHSLPSSSPPSLPWLRRWPVSWHPRPTNCLGWEPVILTGPCQ